VKSVEKTKVWYTKRLVEIKIINTEDNLPNY